MFWDRFFAYFPLIVGLIASLIVLYKEVPEYLDRSKNLGKPILGVLAVVAVFVFVASVFQTHHARKEASTDKEQASKDRQQANIDKAKNDALLGDSKDRLEKLQARVETLQTKSQTAELTKELSEVKAELKEAESKLQGPKARLIASFYTPYYDKIPITQTTSEYGVDGVKFDLAVKNDSNVPAKM